VEMLANSKRQGKEVKDIQFAKEKIKLLLFSDNMIVYKENSKESTKTSWK
jgi:hypothetical protein